jgi:soluble lytic murein transglycosylase-like protein
MRPSLARPSRALVVLALVLSGEMASGQIERSVGADGVISISGGRKKGPRSGPARSGKDASGPAIHMPSDTSSGRLTRYDEHIREAATLYRLPAAYIRAVMQTESNYDPRAVSPAGAVGLMQLMPFTAERMLVQDIYDPRQNILGGARYLRILANQFNGDIHLTTAAYNAGEHAVIRYGGIPPYEETQGYVVKVLENYERYRAAEAE